MWGMVQAAGLNCPPQSMIRSVGWSRTAFGLALPLPSTNQIVAFASFQVASAARAGATHSSGSSPRSTTTGSESSAQRTPSTIGCRAATAAGPAVAPPAGASSATLPSAASSPRRTARAAGWRAAARPGRTRGRMGLAAAPGRPGAAAPRARRARPVAARLAAAGRTAYTDTAPPRPDGRAARGVKLLDPVDERMRRPMVLFVMTWDLPTHRENLRVYANKARNDWIPT